MCICVCMCVHIYAFIYVCVYVQRCVCIIGYIFRLTQKHVKESEITDKKCKHWSALEQGLANNLGTGTDSECF